MPKQSLIERIFEEFCFLTKRQKQKEPLGPYQERLHQAYTAGERVVRLAASTYGLQQTGGVLLGEFLAQHIDIEEIYLSGHQLNEAQGTRIKDATGFNAFLAGLAKTREVGKLRILDLSEAVYSPEQLGQLAKEVLMNNSSLTTLKLDSTSLTDEHLDAMLPYLVCSKLTTLSLRYNDLQGDRFDVFVDKLLTHCPALQFLDLTANPGILHKSAGVLSLARLLTENRNIFVSFPQDQAISNQSLQNNYEHFIPTHLSVMDEQFKMMSAQFDRFEIKLATLSEVPQSHASGVPQDVSNRLNFLEQQFKDAQQTIEDNKREMAQQLVRQALAEGQLTTIQTDMSGFRAVVHSAESCISDLGRRVTEAELKEGALEKKIVLLKQTVAAQADSIDNLEELVNDALELVKSLEVQWQESQILIEKAPEEDLFTDLSPEERIHALAYSKKFKQILVQMHTVAVVTIKGSFQSSASGKVGNAASVLYVLGDCVPWCGAGIKVFSYLLKAVDEHQMKQRMERLIHLGSEPAEVAQISMQLSARLIHCLTLKNRITSHQLSQLLSTASDLAQSFSDNGFYGALCCAAWATFDPVVHAIMDTPAVESRAEQDAEILLAAIVKEGVPIASSNAKVINRLFLYAAPTFTVIDQLFLTLLQQFCDNQKCVLADVDIQSRKREKFLSNVAKSWHNQADAVTERFEDSNKRAVFISALAEEFSSQKHDDHTQGILYFKVGKMTIFSNSKKQHASWHPTALLPETADQVLQLTLTK